MMSYFIDTHRIYKCSCSLLYFVISVVCHEWPCSNSIEVVVPCAFVKLTCHYMCKVQKILCVYCNRITYQSKTSHLEKSRIVDLILEIPSKCRLSFEKTKAVDACGIYNLGHPNMDTKYDTKYNTKCKYGYKIQIRFQTTKYKIWMQICS